jgi:hypothetical protein
LKYPETNDAADRRSPVCTGPDFEQRVDFHLSQQAKEAGAIATAAKRQTCLQIHSLLQISPFVSFHSAVALTSSSEWNERL